MPLTTPATAERKYSQGSNTQTRREIKENAFDILMKTARTAGAFELVLEENPWHMEDDIDFDEAWNNLNHYHNKDYYYDPVFQKAMNKIGNHTFRGSTLDEKLLKTGKSYQDIFLDSFVLCTTSADDEDVTVALPAPVTEPSNAAHVVSLTVCFGRSKMDMKKKYNGSQPEVRSVESLEYWRETAPTYDYSSDKHLRPVLGFVVRYSDGAEIEVGSLRGSFWEGTLVLSPGDSISRLYLINDNDGNSFHNDDEDSYTSSKDSDVEDDDNKSEENDDLEEDEEDEEDDDNEENINTVYIETETETYFIIKNGEVMADEGGGSSYGYSREQSLTAQNEKLLKDISKLVLTRSEKNARPTKKCRTMLCEKKSAKNLPDLNEESRMKLLHIVEMYEKELHRISGSAQKRLLNWYLANNRLHKLVSLQREKIDAGPGRYSGLVADIERVLLVADSKEHQELTRLTENLTKGVRFHVSALKREFQPQIVMYKKWLQKERSKLEKSLIQNTEKDQEDGMTLICKSSLSTFRPHHVRNGKRCSIPGCFDKHLSCGCTVWDCAYCLIPFCRKHRDSHNCKHRSKKMCGWKKGNYYLMPKYCGSNIENNHGKCQWCKVLCCGKCRVPCKGYSLSKSRSVPCPSNVSWCVFCMARYTYRAELEVCDDCTEKQEDLFNDTEDEDDSDYQEAEDSDSSSENEAELSFDSENDGSTTKS